jgi:hypothetical protein
MNVLLGEFLIRCVLQKPAFVFATAFILFEAFFHAALAAGLRLIEAEIPIGQLAHAIVQLQVHPGGTTQVKQGKYGNEKFFHKNARTKVKPFYGSSLLKFSKH